MDAIIPIEELQRFCNLTDLELVNELATILKETYKNDINFDIEIHFYGRISYKTCSNVSRRSRKILKPK